MQPAMSNNLRDNTMANLILTPNIVRPDDFYNALIDMHRDLTEQQSAEVNARLILLLANQVSDPDVLLDAMRIAREVDFT